MAFLSTPPFASTAYPAKFSHHSLDSPVFTPRFSVLGLGFRSISHGVVVRNSNQAEDLVGEFSRRFEFYFILVGLLKFGGN